MKSEMLSKRMSDADYDLITIDFITEMLDVSSLLTLQAKGDWTNIQDVIPMTFKGVCQILRAHEEKLRELEAALPLKANKQEVERALQAKSSTADIKKTVSEMTLSIEAKVSYDQVLRMLEITKQQLEEDLNQRVSYHELKHYLDENGGRQPADEELERVRARVDEMQRELLKKLGQQPTAAKEAQQLQAAVEARLAELEEKLNEKANKQSVAQALHRKANKPEMDSVLSKKADLGDLQRVIAALENKIDITSFEALVRAVEAKADRHELAHLPQSSRDEREIDRTL